MTRRTRLNGQGHFSREESLEEKLPTRFISASMGTSASTSSSPSSSASTEVAEILSTKQGFIETELRGAAMRLHTRSQAPKEGQAEEKKTEGEPYVPSLDDYLCFLVDSKCVYEAFEEAVNNELIPELSVFRETGLERSVPLEKDIKVLTDEFGVSRPSVGRPGLEYAEEIRRIISKGEGGVPEFICHYYNFYFAHTAGGRIIGKKMAALLLDKRTLEFYKWDGDLNKIKNQVKNRIETLAASWSEEERGRCAEATAEAFGFGGALNAYLTNGRQSA